MQTYSHSHNQQVQVFHSIQYQYHVMHQWNMLHLCPHHTYSLIIQWNHSHVQRWLYWYSQYNWHVSIVMLNRCLLFPPCANYCIPQLCGLWQRVYIEPRLHAPALTIFMHELHVFADVSAACEKPTQNIYFKNVAGD